MTRHQQQPHELDVRSGAVYANTTLPAGTRFGPYAMNYTAEPLDKAFAWEVSGIYIHGANWARNNPIKSKNAPVGKLLLTFSPHLTAHAIRFHTR